MPATRRKWLIGFAASLAAPAILRLGLYMPVKAQPIAAQPLWTPMYSGHIDPAKGHDLAYWVDRLKLAEDPAFGVSWFDKEFEGDFAKAQEREERERFYDTLSFRKPTASSGRTATRA